MNINPQKLYFKNWYKSEDKYRTLKKKIIIISISIYFFKSILITRWTTKFLSESL